MSRSHNHDVKRSGAGVVVAIFLGIFLLVLLPFLPLLLSLVEHVTLGTNYVEDGCRTIGIHGLLTTLYEAVVPGI